MTLEDYNFEQYQQFQIGIVVHAPDSSVLFCNAHAENLLGISFEKMYGKDAADPTWRFIDEDGLVIPTSHYPIRRILAEQEPLKDEILGINADTQANVVWVLVNGFPEFDSTGLLRNVVITFYDVSNLKTAEFQLRTNDVLRSAVLDALSAEIAVVTSEGIIVCVNDAWRRFGLANDASPGTLNPIGVNYFDVCQFDGGDLEPTAAIVRAGLHAVIAGDLPQFELEYPCDSPEEKRWFRMKITRMGMNFGGAVVSHEDITERRLIQAKLELATNVFNYTREAIMIVDTDGRIIDCNAAFCRITGYDRNEAIGKNPRFLSSGSHDASFYSSMWRSLIDLGYWTGEIWNRRKDGKLFAELLTISAVRDGDGKAQQYVAMFSDITDIKAHQRELEHLAHFDPLTGLPNRLLLSDRLQQAMIQAQRRQQKIAVVYLDLDGFKTINDRYGHQAGDQLLVNVAKSMKNALREGDTLARIGGDEFVAVLIDLNDVDSCVPLLERMQEVISVPLKFNEYLLSSSASFGVTFYPQAIDIDADQLVRQADQAMYQAKVAGKKRYDFFDAVQDNNLRNHHESLIRIRQAIIDAEFILFYQPQVNIRTGKLVGAEALIRWQHPKKGLLAPASFLPIIENDEIAIDLGEWVIETALSQIERWQKIKLDIAVSVNVGARQLQQSNFVERLRLILSRYPHVNPTKLKLEILETSALADIDKVSQVIEDCRQLGISFALDDFGTGFSSLAYLKSLRVEILKIDKSFVFNMLDDPDDPVIIQGIIGLAKALKREVIAEGVETMAHGAALLKLGCELMQGYGIARPMPDYQLTEWATTWRPTGFCHAA